MSETCPICNGAARPFWPHVWGAAGKRVCVCAQCESFFLSPPNTAAEQQEFDRDYARYIQQRAGAVVPHAAAGFPEMVDDSITQRLADIGPWFEGADSVMEIGAETGGFLDRLRARVPRLVAVDAAPDYVATLKRKGYEAYHYIEDVPAGLRFARICCFSLLEHVPDPAAFLACAAAYLAPGGSLVMEVPSAREPLVTLYDIPAFKDFYFQAMHPQVFSPKAIELLLKRAGFGYPTLRPKQRYGLANHLQWLHKGVPGGSTELAALFGNGTDKAYIAALERAGITDTLYVAASMNHS